MRGSPQSIRLFCETSYLRRGDNIKKMLSHLDPMKDEDNKIAGGPWREGRLEPFGDDWREAVVVIRDMHPKVFEWVGVHWRKGLLLAVAVTPRSRLV